VNNLPNLICSIYLLLQSCFESITGQLQHAIVADCNAVSADNEGYDRLLKNLALICSGKRLETLKAVTCGMCDRQLF